MQRAACCMWRVQCTARTFPGSDQAEADAYLGHVDCVGATIHWNSPETETETETKKL